MRRHHVLGNKTLISSSPELARFADRLIRIDSETRFRAFDKRGCKSGHLSRCSTLYREHLLTCSSLILLTTSVRGFNSSSFSKRSDAEYTAWMKSWFDPLFRVLKPDGSVYICGDWQTSASITAVAGERLIVRNRVTWEREKGRGSARNWKNCSEDIWFLHCVQ